MGPFRSPLLRTSRLISLPPGTEMFQFPGFASLRREMTRIAPGRVAPFGHLGITACVPLPRASRRLPRPSSPPCAQASPTCLPSLDYKLVCAKQNYAHYIAIYFLTNSHLRSMHPSASPDPQRTMSFGKDSISHESSSTKRPRSMTILLSFTFQTASAIRTLSR